MNRRWLFALGMLVGISLLLVGCGGEPTSEEIVAKLREVEASTDAAHAELEINIDAQGRSEYLKIEVWEKKPNKFRAEVLDASDAEVSGGLTVADGDQVWIYQPSKNEVLVGEVGPDEPSSPRDAIRFVDEIVQRALDTSQIELAGEEDVAGKATYKLVLTPTQDEEAILPPGSTATLWVDQESWVVLQAHLQGEILGEGRMTVLSFELNPEDLADSLFQFEIPEGAQVVDIEDKRPTPVTLDEARSQAGFALLAPGYVPAGVTLIDVLTMDEAVILHYDHSDTSFTIIQGWSHTDGEVPLGQKSEVAVRGGTADLITDGLGNSFLIWTENDVTIAIAGHISQEEVLKVAESLQ
jgi:outer membrane lipoprotein-sorting protein